MIHLSRFKGLVPLFCSMIVLLAMGMSRIQTQGLQTSTLASAQAPQILAKKNDPVAIVYHRCIFHPATTTKSASCPQVGKLFFVHNGVALANLTAHEPAAEIGHVSTWVKGGKPQPQRWFICSETRVIRFVEKRPGTQSTPCHRDVEHGVSLYWVRDLTKVTYKSSVTIQKLKQSVTVSKIPITYRVDNSSMAHNGVFVCYIKTGGKTCLTTIPSTSFTGTLYFEHYVNENAAPGHGAEGKSEGAFTLKANASVSGTIQVANLRTLSYPSAT